MSKMLPLIRSNVTNNITVRNAFSEREMSNLAARRNMRRSPSVMASGSQTSVSNEQHCSTISDGRILGWHGGRRAYNMPVKDLVVFRPSCVKVLRNERTDMDVAMIFCYFICCLYTVNHKERDILFFTITLANLKQFLKSFKVSQSYSEK